MEHSTVPSRARAGRRPQGTYHAVMSSAQTALPTYAELVQLTQFVPVQVVPPQFEDANGHVNIRHYLDLGSSAITAAYESVGVDDDYRGGRDMGVFTASNHLNYFSELHVGEEVSVYATFLERSDKAVHAIAYIVDETHRRLAATFESLTVHVDMTQRRAVSMPADLASGLDALIERTAGRFTPPLCGAMRVHR